MTTKSALLGFLAGVAIAVAGFGLVSLLGSSEPEDAALDLPEPFHAEPVSFTVSSCDPLMRARSSCLLVQAGGKRLVFGAPLHMDWRGIGYVDAVFLQDGRPESSMGLMGLRYETWVDGRTAPQALISGELFLDTIQAIDDALVVTDAVVQLESGNRLDSRQAGFSVRPVPADARRLPVFDTGDVRVLARSSLNDGGDQVLAYRVLYQDRVLDIYSCESMTSPMEGELPDAVVVPIIDRTELSVMRYRAEREVLRARQRDIRGEGMLCPSLTDARDFAEEQGAIRLITLGVAEPETIPNFLSAGLTWLPLEREFVVLN